MESFLLALVYALPGPLRPLASPVAARLLRVWRWSDSLARRIKGGFVKVILGAARLRDGMLRFASETVTTLTWIVRVRVPQLIAQARGAIIAWAVARIREATVLLTRAIDVLRRWTLARLADAMDLLDGLRRWVGSLLAPIADRVRALLAHVFGPLASPERLAAWAIGAIWAAFWRLAYGRLEAIAEAVWRRRRALLLRTLVEAERIIGRIL